MALVLTCVMVAGLGGWFAVARWDQTNKVATVASALGAVAAVGIAIWTALRDSSGRPRRTGGIRAAGTGKATARGAGSSATTGVRGKSGGTGALSARDTGDAEAEGGGRAVTGVDGD